MIKFISNIIKSKTPESSKRLIAVLTFLLISYLVIKFATKENAVELTIVLTSFVLALLGVATYENIKTKKDETSKNI